MGPPFGIIIAYYLLAFGGTFFWGFVLGRWRRKKLGLALVFLPYVIYVLIYVIDLNEAVKMGYERWDSDLLGAVLGSSAWLMMMFLIPALVGYFAGFVRSRKKRG